MFGGVLKNLLASGADDIARTATNQAAKKAATTISDDALAAAKRYVDTSASATSGKPYRIHDLSAIDEDRAAHLMRQGYTVAKDSSGKSLNLGDMKPIGADLLDNLNPTGGVFVDYNPQARATIPLADNIKTLADTAKMNPDDLVDIYRGLPDNVEAAINPGDFVTTNPDLAASYGGNVHKMQARYGDILDDLNEPLGEEYIFRPAAKPDVPQSFDDFVKDRVKGKKLVYHRTNADPAELAKGFRSKENTNEAFVSSLEGSDINSDYGKNVVPIYVDRKKLRLDDEFPSGEQHFALNSRDFDSALAEYSQLMEEYNRLSGKK